MSPRRSLPELSHLSVWLSVPQWVTKPWIQSLQLSPGLVWVTPWGLAGLRPWGQWATDAIQRARWLRSRPGIERRPTTQWVFCSLAKRSHSSWNPDTRLVPAVQHVGAHAGRVDSQYFLPPFSSAPSLAAGLLRTVSSGDTWLWPHSARTRAAARFPRNRPSRRGWAGVPATPGCGRGRARAHRPRCSLLGSWVGRRGSARHPHLVGAPSYSGNGSIKYSSSLSATC